LGEKISVQLSLFDIVARCDLLVKLDDFRLAEALDMNIGDAQFVVNCSSAELSFLSHQIDGVAFG
jgi:hypothetical protein